MRVSCLKTIHVECVGDDKSHRVALPVFAAVHISLVYSSSLTHYALAAQTSNKHHHHPHTHPLTTNPHSPLTLNPHPSLLNPRLFLGAPQALSALLPTSPSSPQPAAAAADGSSSGTTVASLQRFVDCWLLVASATFLEELLGVGHMAMLGRFRRRIATAAISR